METVTLQVDLETAWSLLAALRAGIHAAGQTTAAGQRLQAVEGPLMEAIEEVQKAKTWRETAKREAGAIGQAGSGV